VKYSDLLRASDTGDLKLLLDAIAVYWRRIPKADRQTMGDLGKMIDSAVAFRRKLNDIPVEHTSAIRRSAEHILREVAKMEPDEIIEEAHVVHHGTNFEDGMYWLFEDGAYVKCGNHLQFVLDNQPMFIDRLGVDGWKMMHARHGGDGEIMRLVLSSGAIAVQIFGGKKRKGKYQCCQKSFYWLKKKLAKMPMLSNIIRIYDPSKAYPGFDGGIKIILHR